MFNMGRRLFISQLVLELANSIAGILALILRVSMGHCGLIEYEGGNLNSNIQLS